MVKLGKKRTTTSKLVKSVPICGKISIHSYIHALQQRVVLFHEWVAVLDGGCYDCYLLALLTPELKIAN